MKAHYLTFATLVAAGIAASLALIPPDQEMALMYLKSRQIPQAQAIYERLFAEGDQSVQVVIPLVDIYLSLGSVNRAVEVLEPFVERHPKNVPAMEKLAKLYQYAQRPLDYLSIQQRLSELDPSERRLGELADIYNFYGRYEQQIATLRQLTRLYPGNTRRSLDLAQLLAARKRYDEAIASLRLIQKQAPEDFDQSLSELLVYMYLSAGQPQQAQAQAERWVARHPDDVLTFSAILHSHGHPEQALGLFQQLLGKAESDPALLAELTELEITTGRGRQAYERLSRLQEEGNLPMDLLPTLVGLALDHKQVDRALQLAAELDPLWLPDWTTVTLIGHALQDGGEGFLQTFTAKLDEAWRRDHPVLAARIALALGDRDDSEYWLTAALERSDLSFAQKVDIARLQLEMGETGKAMALLEELSDNPGVDAELLAGLAPYYLNSGRIQQGLNLFGRLRAQRSEPVLTEAWMLLAAAAGREQEVREWLQSPEGLRIGPRELNDLYYAAAERGHKDLALVVAMRIHARNSGPEQTRLLVSALLESNRPGDALVYLRQLRRDRAEGLEGLWEQALLGAWKAGLASREEMLAYWTDRLQNMNLSPKMRRQVAFQILDLGEKELALSEFRRLAQNAGPDHPDVQQLIYLWGPLPGEEALAWLEGRARGAGKRDLPGWLKHLRAAGGAERIPPLLASLPRERHSAATDALLLDVLVELRDMKAFDRELLRQAQATTDGTRLQKLAELAFREGRDATETAVWKRLLAVEPDHRLALRKLADAYYRTGDRQNTREMLERYHALYEGDWETRYLLGETYSALGEGQRANHQYMLSLDGLRGADQLNKRMRVVRAQILHRLRQSAAAQQAYAELHRQYPDDTALRADYAAMLIENGHLEQARHVLARVPRRGGGWPQEAPL